MNKSRAGFTLIELLVVIAIIGILAAVAVPFYEGHKIRAKIVEVENTMSVIKAAVTSYRQERESWPACPTVTEIQNSLGVGVGTISRVSGISIVNGIITATIQNINPIVDGEFLSLTPQVSGDGSISWAWGWSAGFPVHLKPKS